MGKTQVVVRPKSIKKEKKGNNSKLSVLEQTLQPIVDQICRIKQKFHSGKRVPNQSSIDEIIELARDVLLMQFAYEDCAKALFKQNYFTIDKDYKSIDCTSELCEVRDNIKHFLDQEPYISDNFCYQEKKKIFVDLYIAVKALMKAAFKNVGAFEAGAGAKLLILGTHVTDMVFDNED